MYLDFDKLTTVMDCIESYNLLTNMLLLNSTIVLRASARAISDTALKHLLGKVGWVSFCRFLGGRG